MPQDEDSGLKADDKPLKGTAAERLPQPLREWALDLTYREIHSMELGLVGLLAGAGFQAGFHTEVAAFTVACVGIAFGTRKAATTKGVAHTIVQREPWYFITVYTTTALLGAWAVGAWA